MDYEDVGDDDAYWELVCEHQDLCSKCYAPWHEHHDVGDGAQLCPE